MPDLRHLEYLVAIAEEGTFSAAAEALHVTQPALTRMMPRMEEELGQKATVIATGGIAKFVVPLCKTPMIYDKDLIIKGLAALYRDNKRK